MKNETKKWKWIAGILGTLLLLPLCFTLVGGIFMMKGGRSHNYRNFGPQRFEHRGADFPHDGAASPEGDAPAPQAEPNAPPWAEHGAPPWAEHEFGGRDGHGYDHKNFSPRHRGRHGFGPFGFIGGIIRLFGMVALGTAGIIFLRNRKNNDSNNTTMTEAEIREAMKNAGIDKIEL